MTDAVILPGDRVLLRPGRTKDLDTLSQIRSEPEVARWWGQFDVEQLEREFIGADSGFVIEVVGEVIGAIQYAEENEPMYRHAGIDIFLTTSRRGEGLGPEAIRVLARYLFDERGHRRLTIDPAAENVAAIRAYERVGFRRVGVMRRYERGPDGIWRDGLLMEMLREEPESSQDATLETQTETNKAIVRRLVAEVINEGKLELIDELFAPPAGEIAKRASAGFRSAFPDWREDIDELVAEGDTVVGHFKCSRTNLGEFLGMPPTGKRMEGMDEVYFLRLRGGKIVEAWGLEDNLARLNQLGLEPAHAE